VLPSVGDLTPNDPIAAQYAPPGAPPPSAAGSATSGDAVGWVLLALPVLGGIAQAALPEALGTVAAYATLLATVILIASDAKRRRQRPGPYVLGAFFLWIVVYPVYMYRRSRWGAPNRLLFAIVAVLLFLAGAVARPLMRTPTRALVRCKAAGKLVGDGFDCSVEHKAGDDGAQVCWDLVLTCANGPGGSTHACGHATPRETTHVPVAYSDLQGAGSCDELTKIGVENVTMTAE
jgi:hypothetical protein